MMSTRLDGRTALVTGAGRGIGAACARAMGQAGARLLLTARKDGELREVAAEFPDSAEFLGADLAEADAAERVADWAIEVSGNTVDILVNNAGAPISRRARNLTAAEVDRGIALNLRAPLLLSVRLGREMVVRRSGSIINITSVAAAQGIPYQAAYAATKGGLEAMTRSLAAEWGPSGVRVNSIAPGPIDTEAWREELPAETRAAVERLVPLRRTGRPDDIAGLAVFLAGEAAGYVTAQVITVDGGMTHTGDLNPGASDG